MDERGAGGEEPADRAAGEGDGLRQQPGVEPGQRRPGPGAAEAPHHHLVVVGPLEVDEAVGQRRAQLPAVGRRGPRVGGGHDPYAGRKLQGADPPFEYQAQEGGLDGGRRGGQLVQEQQSSAGPYESYRPVRRGHRDALLCGVVPDDGQPREVGRLVHAGDHRGERKVQGLGELCQGRGLADPRRAPQEYGQVGGHGQGEGLQLDVGARLGGGVAQQGQQLAGDVELGGVRRVGEYAGRGGRSVCGHVRSPWGSWWAEWRAVRWAGRLGGRGLFGGQREVARRVRVPG